MYLTTFKLEEAPFQPNPDSRYLYLSKAHARAKAYLESSISTADDCVVITGEVGSGKTMLVETFRRELEEDVVVAHLAHAPISSIELLQAVLEELGYLPFRGNKAALLATLRGYLAEQRAAGRKVLLIVDEAHDLALPLLVQLCALVGAEPGEESLLRIALVGRPQLNQLLDAPELTRLAQRARLRFHLTALTPEQTHGYIVHRLAIAGSHGREVFQSACFEIIYRHTGGAPRLINSLCDGALRTAAQAGRDQVLPEDVEAAARELQLPALALPPASESAPAEAAQRPPRRTTRLAKDSAGAPIARLRVERAGKLVAEHRLHAGRMMIGRAVDADLRIDDRTISRHHCQIISSDALSVIQDLNSTNGLYVKDERVRRHILRDGDLVVLGSFQITYFEERSDQGLGKDDATADTASVRMSESDGETTQN